MKTDDETKQRIKKTTQLLLETHDLFRRCFSTYAKSVAEEMRECAEEIRKNGMDSDAKRRLGALLGDLQGTAAAFKRHVIQTNREMKIINHKHKARANDRLLIALERMDRDTTAFQEKLNTLVETSRN
jgi:NTP pyrophosphatase (non-canonical NTP hydrolase)